MLKRRQFLKVSAAASAALVAGACAPASTPSAPAASAAATPRRGGTFVQALTADPAVGSVNLSAAGDGIHGFSAPIRSSLVQLDVNRVAQPELAESWVISPDGKTYTFKLRANAKWHDGRPVTSADVKYTYEEVAAKYSPRFRPYASSLDRIDTPDAQTVVFGLKQPLAVFLQLCAPGQTCILPKHVYEGTDPRTNPDNQRPMGSGAFKFQEWVKGDHITLVRNENYYEPGVPHLDRIISRIVPDAGARSIAFQKGELDFLFRFPAGQEKMLSALPGVYTDDRGTPRQSFVAFNTTKKPLDDLKVRTALAMAIDKPAIVTKAYFGFGAKAAVSHLESPLAPYHNPNIKLPAFDVAGANKLLDEAGYPKGADGRRFSLRIAYDPGRNFGHEVINDGLAAIGIKGELTPMDVATATKTVFADGNFDLFNGQTGDDDPGLSLGVRYHSSNIGGYYANGSRYKNPEVDQLLADGSTTTDVEKRKSAYWKIQEILAKDLPTLPLVDLAQITFYGPKVRGYESKPGSEPYYRAMYLWLTE